MSFYINMKLIGEKSNLTLHDPFKQLEEHAKNILPQWNLIVNETNREHVKDYLADTKIINNEPCAQANHWDLSFALKKI